MKNPRIRRRVDRPVASLRGERLTLAPDLRCSLLAEMTLCEAVTSDFDSRSRVDPDLRAFERSVACERLGEFLLRTGFRAGAFRAFSRAAWEALCGEEYDHGCESLPSRSLRIRFYALFGRMLACRAADLRLSRLEIDPFLVDEARRLGEEYL